MKVAESNEKELTPEEINAILCAYLPHQLKAINAFGDSVELLGLQKGSESVSNPLWVFQHKDKSYLRGYLYQCKPILKPLSDYDDIHNICVVDLGLEIVEEMELSHFALGRIKLPLVKHRIVEIMNKAHIDYNGLIEKGLAVDANTLKK